MGGSLTVVRHKAAASIKPATWLIEHSIQGPALAGSQCQTFAGRPAQNRLLRHPTTSGTKSRSPMQARRHTGKPAHMQPRKHTLTCASGKKQGRQAHKHTNTNTYKQTQETCAHRHTHTHTRRQAGKLVFQTTHAHTRTHTHTHNHTHIHTHTTHPQPPTHPRNHPHKQAPTHARTHARMSHLFCIVWGLYTASIHPRGSYCLHRNMDTRRRTRNAFSDNSNVEADSVVKAVVAVEWQ